MLQGCRRTIIDCSPALRRLVCTRYLSVISRPPVVTIMGHVDHGKTTLLDALRTTDVAAGEAGGITQKISVFQHKNADGDTFTFIDTPGHAAFRKMRQRGSMVTDVVILVVAATEGVMPQTVESIQHIKAAQVPVIVAINKIDQSHANVQSCLDELFEHDIVAESLGGNVQVVPISALKGIGLENLVESLNAQCMLIDLKADTEGPCQGTVVEIHNAKGMKSAVVLVQNGSLKAGDGLLSDMSGTRVKRLQTIEGENVQKALPGMPVVTSGWTDLPRVGDPVSQIDIKEMKAELKRRKEKEEAQKQEWLRILKSDPSIKHEQYMKDKGRKRVSFMIQADCIGSVEVINDMLGFKNPDLEANVFSYKITPFNAADIKIAEAIDAQLICFNSPLGILGSDNIGCTVYHHDVIYHLAAALERELQPYVPIKLERRTLGRGVISELHGWEKLESGLRQGLKQSKLKRKESIAEAKEKALTLNYGTKKRGKFPTIAGVQIHSGVFQKNAMIAIHRKGEYIWEGPCKNLRYFNSDIEVTDSSECGILFNKIMKVLFAEGDTIHCYLDKPMKVPILSEHFGVHETHSDQRVKKEGRSDYD